MTAVAKPKCAMCGAVPFSVSLDPNAPLYCSLECEKNWLWLGAEDAVKQAEIHAQRAEDGPVGFADAPNRRLEHLAEIRARQKIVRENQQRIEELKRIIGE